MTELLENAIDSIKLGIEDYRSNDPKRPLSALRNYYAGVLLLGKQCLLNAAPAANAKEVLSASFMPESDGMDGVKYKPSGHRTVDLDELRKRFKSFGLLWPDGKIKILQKLRNEFEHYHSDAPKQQIQQAIAECFPIIEGFFQILEENPTALLGEAWDTMLSEKHFFTKIKKECEASLEKLSIFPFFTEPNDFECSKCGSSLLYQINCNNEEAASIIGRCKACGTQYSGEEFVSLMVQCEFGVDDYISAKDGANPVINNCPECSLLTYVEYDGVHKCYMCEFSIESDCARCNATLNVQNMSVNNSNFCDYCDHVMNKND